jgi:uncharacterized membrane protein YccC
LKKPVALRSLHTLDKLLESDRFEPLLSWGLRMGIAACVPLVWGVYTQHEAEAALMTLTAEAIGWMELKGNFTQRIKVLLVATVLAMSFGFLGSISGTVFSLSICCMFIVGFLTGIFKNIGERGSGLAISIFVMFIFTNAHPCALQDVFPQRIVWIGIGGLWSLLLGILFSIFIPVQKPYRRSIALIWKSIAALQHTLSEGFNLRGKKNNIRAVYLSEREVRHALDNSLQFHAKLAHQEQQQNKQELHLAHIRKAAALIGSITANLEEELRKLAYNKEKELVCISLYGVMKAHEQLCNRMAYYMLSLKKEDYLLVQVQKNRLQKLNDLFYKKHLAQATTVDAAALSIYRSYERILKLIGSTLNTLNEQGKEPMTLQSYGLYKTLYILQPKEWLQHSKTLFNINTFTFKFALRAALASTLGFILYRVAHIPYGYWIPFTTLIVMQPYVATTNKKALERIAGTLLGTIGGGLILSTPASLHLKEVLFFISAVCMIVTIRKSYSISTFFITLSLVLLYSVDEALSYSVLLQRIISTTIGSALAVIAGFLFLPTFEKNWLPKHIIQAISKNFNYFQCSVQSTSLPWTRFKRLAESHNSDAFDSLQRYMQEPLHDKKKITAYYALLTHIVRITRELNKFNIEKDDANQKGTIANEEDLTRIREILYCFDEIKIQLSQHVELKAWERLNVELQQVPMLNSYQRTNLYTIHFEIHAIKDDLGFILSQLQATT